MLEAILLHDFSEHSIVRWRSVELFTHTAGINKIIMNESLQKVAFFSGQWFWAKCTRNINDRSNGNKIFRDC